ncbi:MAG: hypothetical protein H0V39_01260 [Nitrosomonas sp.]|nr:hypothetical protein [Nitrosomonas sp.]
MKKLLNALGGALNIGSLRRMHLPTALVAIESSRQRLSSMKENKTEINRFGEYADRIVG